MAPRKKKTKRRSFRINLILAVGIALLVSGLVLKEHRRRVLSFDGDVGQIQQIYNPPIQIEIPKTKTNLIVEPGSITNGVWTISEDGATHLLSSSAPGQGGNTVIYAHNKKDLFGPIRWLNVGDEIILKNMNGEVFNYEITDKKTVSPKEISYVLQKNEETLTLYTCTGFADKDRYIVIAKPKQ